MSDRTVGRHRAPGRYNPLTEARVVVSRYRRGAPQPLTSVAGVVAATGALVATLAAPAQAAPRADSVSGPTLPAVGAEGFDALLAPATRGRDAARSRAAAGASASPAVTAPEAAAPSTANAPDVGRLAVTAVAKPKPKPRPRPRPAHSTGATGSAARADGQAAAARADRSSRASRSRPAPAPKPEPKPQPAPASGVLGAAASLAGTPYRYGGSTPSGFDCSGYTAYVYARAGVSLPRTAEGQRRSTTRVSNPEPGDLVFFGSPAYHVGIYAGNGRMWDAPRAGLSVGLRPVFSGVSGYGRP